MMTRVLWLVVVLGALSGAAQAKPRAGAKRQVLFFTKSSGYEHAVIKQVGGAPSLAEKVLKELGEKNNFEITHSKDGRIFTPDGIAKFDAFVFFTTLDLTTEGKDKNPPMPANGKAVLLDAIAAGKGFVGIHAASDTFHSGPSLFEANGDKADPYIKMLGGEFIKHGEEQPAKVQVIDAKFPGLAGLGSIFESTDEWYSLKNFNTDMHVLMVLQTWTLKNTRRDSVYRRAPYPITWARTQGKGRVFYTAMGHRDDVWANPRFRDMLVGGIKWAVGDVKIAIKPNLAAVAPGYSEIPPNDPSISPPPPVGGPPAPRSGGPDAGVSSDAARAAKAALRAARAAARGGTVPDAGSSALSPDAKTPAKK